jgi:hypothetical protein
MPPAPRVRDEGERHLRVFAKAASASSSNAPGRQGWSRLSGILALSAFALFVIGLAAAPAGATPPTTTIDPNPIPSYASVEVSGKVVPTGPEEPTFKLELSSDNVHWNEPVSKEHTDDAEGNISRELGGLKGGTHYWVRLKGVNIVNEEFSLSAEPNPEFTTLPVVKPAILAVDDAAEVAYTTARATGKVERPANPNAAFDTSCQFEYVTDAQFTATGFEGALAAPCEQNPITTPEEQAQVSAGLVELKPDTVYHLRLAASDTGGTEVVNAPGTFTTLPVVKPTILGISDASAVTYNGAKVSAVIERPENADPAFDVECNFEYVTETEFASTGYVSAATIPCDPASVSSPPAGQPTEVRAELTGLRRATGYRFRVVASNLGGAETLEADGFTTRTSPQAQTLGAGAVGTESATLAAQINPSNSQVVYQFEWGVEEGLEDETYEHRVPLPPSTLSAQDESFHQVSAPLTGLTAATTYHYRIAATNPQTNETSTGLDRTFTTLEAAAGESCPNVTARVGVSAGLPDCRAYEWVTPDSNGIKIELNATDAPTALADGTAIKYLISDSPRESEGSYFENQGVSRLGPNGWATTLLAPPARDPANSYLAIGMAGAVSSDYTEAVVRSPQPLAGPTSPSGGQNLYIRRRDGTYVPLTRVGVPFNVGSQQYTGFEINSVWSSGDWSHIYFKTVPKQLLEDPDEPAGSQEANTYEWFNGDLRLIGVLPGSPRTIAPHGSSLAAGLFPGVSYDGEQVAFVAVGYPGLYLRSHAQTTVEVSASQRTGDPEPNNPIGVNSLGITSDGSQVLFTSRSELTNDSNTGETNGHPNQSGNDLYSYAVGTGVLTDLTVDDEAADAATGADVIRVLGISKDASYVYLVARGDLGAGGSSGSDNLYVEHEGHFRFVAPATGIPLNEHFYVTPDGLHAGFVSTDSLTGYDNANRRVVYEYSYDSSALQCASCRPDGNPPTSGAAIVGRAVSNDGSRVFFQSTDAIIPGSSSGLPSVFEFSAGKLHLLTPGDGQSSAYLLDASGSGNDVFILTHDELVPGTGAVAAIYDARVNGDPPPAPPAPGICLEESCREKAIVPSASPSPGSVDSHSPGELAAPKSKTIRGRSSKIRVTAPGAGELSVSGRGIRAFKKSVSAAGPVALTVGLNGAANKIRLERGHFRTKIQVRFNPKYPGPLSPRGQTTVSLTFKASAKQGAK